MIKHTSSWMIDSGSFKAITPHKKDFNTYVTFQNPLPIRALGGHLLNAIAIGSVILKSNIGDEFVEIQDVLHVPTADGRLISVGQLIRKSMKVLFNDLNLTCTIFNSNRHPLMTVPLDDQTYQFTLVTDVIVNVNPPAPSSYNVSRVANSLEELHLKLGHAHPFVIQRMAKKLNWNISDPEAVLHCESCTRGKSTKVIHDTVASRTAEHVGHIVSADLIDLHDTPSIGDFKYVSVLVDQYSYYTSILPLKGKSAEDTKIHILAFNAFIRSKTGSNIRILRSDAGNEYRGTVLSSLRELGIYPEVGAPHEPRDNGFVERRNRTLTDTARTILLDSKLPLTFWPFAYDYACYTQNRLGRRGYAYDSPYYRVFGQIPDYGNLHPFGISCYMQHTELNTHKLSARSDRAIFVGYCNNTNAYKIFYNNNVRIEQSVHFLSPTQTPESVPVIQLPISTDQNLVRPVPVFRTNDPVDPIPHLPSTSVPTSTTSIPVEPIHDLTTRHSTRPSLQLTIEKIRASVGPKRRASNGNQALVVTKVPKDIESIPAEHFPQDPIGYKPSLKGPLASFWAEERQKEITNWINLRVAEVSDLPEGHSAIPGHWIHTVKKDAQGKFVRLKARCVADGNHQIFGHNYSETYAATPAPEVARLLLTIAASKEWEVHQMDVDCAYLNAELTEPVYMRIPPGVNINHKPGQVFKLLRALYGLKQAGREWAIHLKGILHSIGWKQSPREPCLYSKGNGEFILVYVDDLMIVAPDVSKIQLIKDDIGKLLKVKDLGEIHDYLGIEVIRNRPKKTFYLRQVGLIDDIVHIMSPEKIKTTPMSSEYDSTVESPVLDSNNHNKYRSVLGKLLYLSRITRPDLSISTNLLGRNVACPTVENLKAMNRAAGYLLGSRDLYLALDGTGELFLTGMSDADWAGDTVDRKSTSGYICYLGKAPIMWSSTKQKCVAGSTMHAEYVALSDAAREMVYLMNLASSITQIRGPALLLCDNTAAETIAKGQSGNVTKGAKHIDIRYHIIKELIESGTIQVDRIGTNENISDDFTKPLGADKFIPYMNDLMLQNLYTD